MIRKIIKLTTKSMNEISENIYDGVNGSPYDDPKYHTEMSFRYKNYNPETNTFRVNLYTGLRKTEPKELQPYEWEHFDDKKYYERTNHTEKEKWILKSAKEIVKEYEGYPNHVKDYAEVNKSKYEDYNFNNAELWIDYNKRGVCIRLFCPKTGRSHVEYLDLDNLEENYYEEVESNFLYNVKEFKNDLNHFINRCVEGSAEDFLERVKENEKEEDYDIDTAIESYIDLMKDIFTDWLQNLR